MARLLQVSWALPYLLCAFGRGPPSGTVPVPPRVLQGEEIPGGVW